MLLPAAVFNLATMRSRRVLLAFPCGEMCDQLRQGLGAYGYDPIAASEAYRALRALRALVGGEREPVAVVLSASLPDRGADELLHALSSEPLLSHVPVILVGAGRGSLNVVWAALPHARLLEDLVIVLNQLLPQPDRGGETVLTRLRA